MALATVLVLAAALSGALTDADAEEAIWRDVEMNAAIGNGNRMLDIHWYLGGDQLHGPRTSLEGLACSGRGQVRICRFRLRRVANPASTWPGEAGEPGLLACRARLAWTIDGDRGSWEVDHDPIPPGGAHSRTSMTCRVVREKRT